METVELEIALAALILDIVVLVFGVSVMTLILTGRYSQHGVLGYRYIVNDKVLWTQILTLISIVLFGIVAIIALSTHSDTVCFAMMVTAATCYGSITIFLYLFLFIRSRMVKFGRGLAMKILESSLLILMAVYVLSVSILLFAKSTGTIVPITDNPQSTICAYRIVPWIGVYIFISDSVISTGYLILFIVPLLSGNQTYRSTAMENLVLSTIMILSTSCTMIVFAFFVTDNNSSMVAACITGLDVILNMSCACLMTRKGWKKEMARTKSTSQDAVIIV